VESALKKYSPPFFYSFTLNLGLAWRGHGTIIWKVLISEFTKSRTINLTPLWVLISVNVLIFIATSIASGSFFSLSPAVTGQIGVITIPWAINPGRLFRHVCHDGIIYSVQYDHPLFLRNVRFGARR